MEFTLIFPIFALMLFSLIDFGLIFGGFNAMRSGVQAGARNASLDYVDSGCPGPYSNAMVCTVADRIGGLTGIKSGTLQVFVALPDGPSTKVGDPVEVCAYASMASSTGFTSPFIDGKRFSATSEVPIEQAPGTWASGVPTTLPASC